MKKRRWSMHDCASWVWLPKKVIDGSPPRSLCGQWGSRSEAVPPPATDANPSITDGKAGKRVAVHVTIDPEEGIPSEQYADAMQRLAPASIAVDMGGALGRLVLASLQARGLPATALEKRPRPALPELQRIEELSKAISGLQGDLETARLELRLLREYKHDVQILIARLE